MRCLAAHYTHTIVQFYYRLHTDQWHVNRPRDVRETLKFCMRNSEIYAYMSVE